MSCKEDRTWRYRSLVEFPYGACQFCFDFGRSHVTRFARFLPKYSLKVELDTRTFTDFTDCQVN